MSLKLGCIADDFTGGTDLANNLVRAGMRTVQVIGVPNHENPGDAPDCDAVVVALKSRTAAVAEAVAQSLAAARWLRAQGATQIYFKVCSTFDSTPRGNIGPVAEALMALLAADTPSGSAPAHHRAALDAESAAEPGASAPVASSTDSVVTDFAIVTPLPEPSAATPEVKA